MKKLLVLLAGVGGLLLTATPASAVGYANPVNVPTHQSKPLARFFRPQPLPAFQAAPWYLYWPYDGHFQTIAPMAQGMYYAPPMYTGNPYMPGQYPQYMSGNPHPTFPVGPVK